jgi:hypothetical protein
MTDTTTTPNEAEAVTEQALGELEHLDPNDLQVGDNIREYANLNKPFLDSIAECRLPFSVADRSLRSWTFVWSPSSWRTRTCHLSGGS